MKKIYKAKLEDWLIKGIIGSAGAIALSPFTDPRPQPIIFILLGDSTRTNQVHESLYSFCEGLEDSRGFRSVDEVQCAQLESHAEYAELGTLFRFAEDRYDGQIRFKFQYWKVLVRIFAFSTEHAHIAADIAARQGVAIPWVSSPDDLPPERIAERNEIWIGSIQQCVYWMEQLSQVCQRRIVTRLEQIMGLCPPLTVHLCGQYWLLPEWSAIVARLSYMSKFGDIDIIKHK